MGSEASTGWRGRVKGVAARLKAEYEAGKDGDEAPPEPIWATPQQQLSALVGVLRGFAPVGNDAGDPDDVSASPDQPGEPPSQAAGDGHSDGAVPDEQAEESDADEVAAAIRGVDWAVVRAATADRTADATKAMRSMAEHVDWSRVQPVAAQVSSALIAAIASGQLGVGGRLASTVARAVTNQNGLGQRVGEQLGRVPDDQPPDFRRTIEAAAREV